MNIDNYFIISFSLEVLPKTLQLQAERPHLKQIFMRTLAECQELIHPLGIWEFFPLRTMHEGKYFVKESIAFSPGQDFNFFTKSVGIGVGICTIGADFDTAMVICQKSNMTKAVILDSLGSWIVQNIRGQLIKRMQDSLQKEGLQVSGHYRPGEGSLPITDQAQVFQLLDASTIGVSLNESMLMSPLKSSSFILNVSRTLEGDVADQ